MAVFRHSSLVLAILCSQLLQSSSSVQLVIVTPDCSTQPPPCIELSDALRSLTSNTTLELRSGQHTLHSGATIHSMSDVSLIGESVENVTTVTCQDGFGLSFANMTNMTISGLTISGCGLTNTSLEDAERFISDLLNSTLTFLIPSSIKIGILFGHCRNLNVSNTLITKTVGIGMLGINILGRSVLSRVNFTYNIRPFCYDKSMYRYPYLPNLTRISPQIGGGAYFIFEDARRQNLSTEEENGSDDAFLDISSCVFMYNAECSFAGYTNVNHYFSFEPYVIGGGGGLSIFMPQKSYSARVYVTSSVFERNDARYGGGAHVALFAAVVLKHVHFHGCTFNSNGIPCSSSAEYDWMNGTSRNTGGAGAALFTDLLIDKNVFHGIPSHGIYFNNTNFTSNAALVQGGGVLGYSLSEDLGTKYNNSLIYFFRCNFKYNSAKYGSALYLSQRRSHGVDGTLGLYFCYVTIEDSRMAYSPSSGVRGSSEVTSALDLRSVLVVVDSLTIDNNAVSGIHILSSLVLVSGGGSLRILNNRAYRGGGVYMEGYSPAIFMSPNSTLVFCNNTATAEGGGVYYKRSFDWVDILEPHNSEDCFLSSSGFLDGGPLSSHHHMFDFNISIQFIDNKATLGSVVYGSTLESCSWAHYLNVTDGNIYLELYDNYNSTFYFSTEPTGKEMITTEAFHIRVSEEDRNISTYPGQEYRITVLTMDMYHNEIETVLTSDATSMYGSHDVTLGPRGYWYNIINHTIPLYVRGRNDTIILTLYSPGSYESPQIEVSVLDCPIGFEYDEDSYRCRCNVSVGGIVCDNDNISLIIQGKWIGCVFGECSTTDDLVVLDCHFSYCNPTDIKFDYTDDDYSSQCAEGSHKGGIMCGACQEGYSAVFGSEYCQKCSTENAWQIVLMASFCGLVLFLCIPLLGLTVDKGWTHMLFMFSNIVFPYTFFEATPAAVFKYALAPARLVSLQEVTNICFYHGLTPIAETGFNFLFPVYLYVIMAVFTILCRCSSFMSKYFSPTKTLMTLIFVSSARVITISIVVLCPISITNIGGTNRSLRWLFDPNVKYFVGWHALLGAVSIFLFVAFMTLLILLLFPTQVYKHAHYFTPFFDVLWASFKPKYHFWLSIRIMFSTCILIFAKLFPPKTSILINLILLLIFLYSQSMIHPYKDRLINVCDSFLVMNVIFLHFGGYIRIVSYDASGLSWLEISYVAFFLSCFYVVILVAFLWYNREGIKKLPNLCLCRRKRERDAFDERGQLNSQTRVTHSSVSIHSESHWQIPKRRRDFTRIRESLLENVSG